MMFGVAGLIGIGAICDYFDGYLARRLGATSPSGEILDSFADLITFCIAPALMMTRLALDSAWPFIAFFVCVVPIVSGVIRLTKFMVNKKGASSPKHYTGLPTTVFGLASAFAIAVLAIRELTYLPLGIFIGFISAALLMIMWRLVYPKHLTKVRLVLWVAAAAIIVASAIWWLPMIYITISAVMLLLGLYMGSTYARD